MELTQAYKDTIEKREVLQKAFELYGNDKAWFPAMDYINRELSSVDYVYI